MLHDAVHKQGAFEFLDINYDNLRILFPVYDVPTTLVVHQNAKIGSLDDLKNKRINAGIPRSPQHFMTNLIMQAKNWTPNDFSLIVELGAALSEDTMAFCHGTVQGMFFLGVHPDSSLQQLFKLCKAELISMDDQAIQKLIEGHAAFSKITIPAQTYPSQANRIVTLGTRMYLVGSEDLDTETTQAIIRAIDLNRKAVQSAHPALASFSPQATSGNGIGLPLHTGAMQYFQESSSK
jgi:TRAP transporter TAXI family solute receptor